ncbi:hypothetical protein K438DRAFT_1758159 [Mycena galopus ATCC 62051]|nr:hypothetical protein K438DRAFT_1758159 [Mycena galopus ATCC 62051]
MAEPTVEMVQYSHTGEQCTQCLLRSTHMSPSSESSAYWATLVELEVPTLAPWFFIRDHFRPTRLVLAECNILWLIACTPFLSLLWAGKPADRQVSIYAWVLYIAFALFVPSLLWTHINNSRVINRLTRNPRMVRPWWCAGRISQFVGVSEPGSAGIM